MLNNMTWGDYWSTLIILCIIYYGCVVFLFYKSNLKQIFSQKMKLLPEGQGEIQKDVTKIDEEPNSFDVISDEAQFAIDEITAYLDQVRKVKCKKEEIIFGIRQILKKYVGLGNSEFRDVIDKIMNLECQSKCVVHLSNEELRQVWLD